MVGDPVEMTIQTDKERGLRSRVDEVVGRIEGAAFTGKADKPRVVALYRDYYSRMHNALTAAAPGGIPFRYEGERDDKRRPHGTGTQTFENGDVYKGEAVASIGAPALQWSPHSSLRACVMRLTSHTHSCSSHLAAFHRHLPRRREARAHRGKLGRRRQL